LDKLYDDFVVEVVFNDEIYLTKDDIIQDRKDPKGINYLSIVKDKKAHYKPMCLFYKL
jgi:hypothetical protein